MKTTPDGRYLVIDGVLWRRTDPSLSEEEVAALKSALGRARAAVKAAKRAGDEEALRAARRRVHEAKVGLGERGSVWWDDGSPDLTRRHVENTVYADWFLRSDDES